MRSKGNDYEALPRSIPEEGGKGCNQPSGTMKAGGFHASTFEDHARSWPIANKEGGWEAGVAILWTRVHHRLSRSP